jgi:uncharacterized protein (TIGR03000 family)
MKAMAEEDPTIIDEPTPGDDYAVITMIVPLKAKVTIAGEATLAEGKCRYFTTPTPVPGKMCKYEVKVEWKKDGHDCSVTRWVPIRAGEVTRAYFTLPIVPPPEPK